MTMPYSNPLPPKVIEPEPPTIQKPTALQTQVRIQAPKPREDKKKYTTLSLDQDLTQRVQTFVDAQGFPSLNEGIRVLLRAALSSDPVLAAVGVGWQKGYWSGRVAFFEA